MKGLEYEYPKEDKTRRKIVPTRDYRLVDNWTNRYERFTWYCRRKYRQGFNILIKYLKSRQII